MPGISGPNSRSRLSGAVAASLLVAATAHAQPEQGPVPPQAAPVAAAASDTTPVTRSQVLPDTEEHSLGGPSEARATPRSPAQPSAPAPARPWIGQTLLSLGAVLGLAIVAAGVMKMLARGHGGLRASLGAGGRSPSGIMEILGRYPVGRGATLVLLKLDRRVLLLSQSAGGRLGAGAGFQTLCEITDPEEVASILVKARDADGDSMSEKFRSILGRFDRTMDPAEAASEGRRITASPSGDRAELWDDRNAIPVVDLTRQPGPPETGAASLRRRLASIRPTPQGAPGA